MKHRTAFVLFVLASALWCLSPAAAGAAEPVQFQRQGNEIHVTIGGKPFTTYYFNPDIAKPYLQPLRSEQGTIVTRSYPIGNTIPEANRHDHALEPHQRPLYFDHGDIDGLDFWSEEAFNQFYGRGGGGRAYGRMVFTKVDEMNSGPDSGTIQAEFDLISPNKRVIATETQTFTFRGDADTRIIDCQFVIHAGRNPVVFGDTKEGTFGIRLAPELNSPPAHMIDSKGAEGERGIWGTRANWVNYDGTVDGENLGIAVFDSPRSFRHPTYWHARGYGLFAANPFGLSFFTRDPMQDGSWTVPEGKSLLFRYRVFIHHGDYKQADVAGAYRKYAEQEH
jgi:Family of unknown function (DUF6807)